MSAFPKEFAKHAAEALGVANLRDDVAHALTSDMEYRMREVIQEAKKFMRHSRRTFMTTHDINAALKVKNVEPLYGFVAPRPVKYKRADASVFYIEDEELDFDKVLSAPLPKLPLDVALSAHWLAIDGVQPAIPQNPPPNSTDKRAPTATSTSTAAPSTTTIPGPAGAPAVAHPLVKDVLAKELQLYYTHVTAAVVSRDDTVRETALGSLATDPGLQPLLPYLIKAAQDHITKHLRQLWEVAAMVAMIDAVLRNAHFFMVPYLHQLIPLLLTTIVGRHLGSGDPAEDHWALRRTAARLLAGVLAQHQSAYPLMTTRVQKTLLTALVDDSKAVTSKYGAVVALALLGAHSARLLVAEAPRYEAGIFAPVLGGGSCAVPAANERNVRQLLDAYAAGLALVYRADQADQPRATPRPAGDAMDVDAAPDADRAALIAQYGAVLGAAVADAVRAADVPARSGGDEVKQEEEDGRRGEKDGEAPAGGEDVTMG
ncbi:Transcription initiation factor TFIID subunit 6 [Allomyces arbusculus]|nr:Transcription initiation factor TFIID subunit 6 [Allomyces arbusculus]